MSFLNVFCLYEFSECFCLYGFSDCFLSLWVFWICLYECVLRNRQKRVRMAGFVFTNPWGDGNTLVCGEMVVDRPTQSVTHIANGVYLGFVWCVMARPHQFIVTRCLAHVVFCESVEFEVVVLLRVAEVLPGSHGCLGCRRCLVSNISLIVWLFVE